MSWGIVFDARFVFLKRFPVRRYPICHWYLERFSWWPTLQLDAPWTHITWACFLSFKQQSANRLFHHFAKAFKLNWANASLLVLFKCLIIVLSPQLQHDLVYCLGGRLILNLTLLVWVIVFTCIHIYCHCHRYHQQYRANWYCCAVFDVFLLIRDTINAAKFFFSLLNQL